MPVDVDWIVVVIEKVPSDTVVDIPITVVVDSIVANFALINPNIGCQILVVVIGTSIGIGDYDRGVTGGDIPGSRRGDSRQSIQLWKPWVVGNGHRLINEILFSVFDARKRVDRVQP